MTWTQTYTPVAGSLVLSALVAALPVVVLLGSLAFGHAKAHWAALAGLAASLTVAVLVFRMPPVLAGAAALNGAAYGLFPIGWIVLGAIFVYDLAVKSGGFEVVKDTIAGVAADRRIQALLIAFCFGAFIEGAAGFGTPVAISAAMLIGLGFRPLQAAGLALIANTAPVAFGALGIPVITLATVTGLPLDQLSAMVGRILLLFCVLVPFWVIGALCGLKKMMEIWPACLTAGVSFGVAQFAFSNFVGPSLAAIVPAVVSMTSLVVLLEFWQPKEIWSFEHEDHAVRVAAHANRRGYSAREGQSLAAVGAALDFRVCLGFETGQGFPERVLHLQYHRAGAAQGGDPDHPGGEQAYRGTGHLHPSFGGGHGNQPAAGRLSQRIAAGIFPVDCDADLPPHAAARSPFAAHDCRHAGLRV